MDVLPVSFAILKFCGTWTESKRASILFRVLHFSYRCAVTILIYHFTISELIELTFCLDDIASFTEILFLSISYVGLCVKFGNFIACKKELTELLGLLRSDICRANNVTEMKIIAKYNERVKWSTLAYFILCQLTGGMIVVLPILSSKSAEHPLPAKVYLPYSITSAPVYLATYVQQAVTVAYAISLNVSIDSLVYGFNLLICAQMELLSYRFNSIFEKGDIECKGKSALQRHLLTRDCIRHHLLLHKIVERVESIFMWTVAVFFFFSLTALCTSIFQISKHPILSLEFMTLVGYLTNMLFQIFCYCWYGNELELKSKGVADAVYFSNWMSGTLRERRSLLIVMTVSQKGLILSYYGIIVVAVDTFMWVLKTAYSAFNLLQQVSD